MTDATDDSTAPERRLGDVLPARDETIATAESCTGGLIGARITAVPGASDYFAQTVATYTYASKMERLAVSRESLDSEGAVSEPVARQMAAGVRDTAGTTWGVATTGIAGPTGGTEEKPVGTVFIGVAHRGEWGSDETWTDVTRYEFDGDRETVRERTVDQALADVLAAVDRTESNAASGDPQP